MENTTKTNKFAGKCEACGQNVPAGEGVLKGRMVGGSRRWLVEHTACPPKVEALAKTNVIPSRLDPEYIRFIGKLILEQGSVEAGWQELRVCAEYFDGEREIEVAERARFDAHLPYALAQNKAIHPEWSVR